jgi:hypothetical protein
MSELAENLAGRAFGISGAPIRLKAIIDVKLCAHHRRRIGEPD